MLNWSEHFPIPPTAITQCDIFKYQEAIKYDGVKEIQVEIMWNILFGVDTDLSFEFYLFTAALKDASSWSKSTK